MNSEFEQAQSVWTGLNEVSVWLRMSKMGASRACREAGLNVRVDDIGRLWFRRAEVAVLAARRLRLHRSRMILKVEAFGEIEFEDDDLLSTGDVGLLLGVTTIAITARVRAGTLPFASKTSGGHARIRFGDIRGIVGKGSR